MGQLSSYLPGNRPRAVAVRNSRTTAPIGNSFKQGPEFKFSFKWLFTTYDGLIWVQVYLWLIKDWSWSQLQWFYPGMIAGSLALLLGTFLIGAAIYMRAYSEASAGFGTLLWIFTNYWWMVGEFWGYKITLDSPSFFIPDIFREEEYEGGDLFYEQHTEDAQVLGTLTVSWLFFSIFILPWFYNDRDSAFLKALTDNCPRYGQPWFFRDFLEFENAHLFFWGLKDCFWAYGSGPGYLVGFILTMSIMLETVYYLWTSANNWVHLIHYISLVFWVAANGLWAIGELFVEDPQEDIIPGKAYDDYRFLPIDKENIKFFWGRNASGWLFFCSVLVIVVLYVYWLCFATINPLPLEGKPVEDKKQESEEVKVEKESKNPGEVPMKIDGGAILA